MDASEFEEGIFEPESTSAREMFFWGAVFLAIPLGVGLLGDHLTTGSRVIVIGLGIAAALASWRDGLVRIRVGRTSFTAEYLLRKRAVAYAEIVDINLEARAWGSMLVKYPDVIVVKRRHGFSVVLWQFGEDAEAFDALQVRWSAWMDHAHPGWRTKPPLER